MLMPKINGMEEIKMLVDIFWWGWFIYQPWILFEDKDMGYKYGTNHKLQKVYLKPFFEHYLPP